MRELPLQICCRSSGMTSLLYSRLQAREGGFGGGEAGEVSAVRGREEIGRGGLAGEEQTVIDRCGEHRAILGMARERIGIGAARPGVLQPGGRGERRYLAANVIAEKARELAGGKGKDRPLPFPLERRREPPAEKGVDRRPVERPHL